MVSFVLKTRKKTIVNFALQFDICCLLCTTFNKQEPKNLPRKQESFVCKAKNENDTMIPDFETCRAKNSAYTFIYNPNGMPICTITPIVIDDVSANEMAYLENRSVKVHSTAHNVQEGFSRLPFKKYSKHLTDVEDVSMMNRLVLGKIHQWRMLTMELLANNKYLPWMLPNYTVKQHKWAKDKVLLVERGISKFNKLPVQILNEKALIMYVHGVDTAMMADLVYNISNCSKFEIIGVPWRFFKAFIVWTKFYGVGVDKESWSLRAYGHSRWKLGYPENKVVEKVMREPITTIAEARRETKLKL